MLTNEKYKNGQVKNSFKNDYLIYYFKSGIVKAEGKYINNKMEGTWKFYRENGTLWQVGNFLNNMKEGKWIRYNKDGIIDYSKQFKTNVELKQ